MRYVCQFSGDSNFSKNGFWGRDFKNLSADSRSVPPRNHVFQFSVKMDIFEFIGLTLGKLPNYVQYFGSNNVDGVAESWWRLKWDGWRWVHGLVIPIFLIEKKKSFSRYLDFCAFVNSTDFKICDVIIGIAGSGISSYAYFFFFFSHYL